jgi:branched-chain amino acid transport system substrate-binding protein
MRGKAMFGFAALALFCLTSPAARAEDRPLKIGLISDMSGVYSDFFGEGSVLSAQLAIEDAGGVVAGRKIELLTADHLNKPDNGAAIARKMIEVDGVDAIIDVPTSSVALAVNEVVREKNKTFLATGPFTSALTGANCSPNTVHWSLDNWALAHTLASAEVAAGGKTWFFITSDYSFGHDLERVATESIIKAGGKVLGSVRHPLDTPDMASFILQAQASPAEVIGFANAGHDTTRAIKAAADFKLAGTKKIAGLTTNVNNINAIGLAQAAGLLAAGPFYWDLNDETRAWARRFQARHPRHNMPNEMQAGVYSALVHYFKILNQGVDPSDGKAVVDAMKAMPTDDVIFGKGLIRPDGRKIHAMYLYETKTPEDSREPWDYFTVKATIAADDAFRPLNEGHCPLVR